MGLNYNNIDFSKEISYKFKMKCKGMYALDRFDDIKPELNIMSRIWLGCKSPQEQADWQVAEQQRWYQKEQ